MCKGQEELLCSRYLVSTGTTDEINHINNVCVHLCKTNHDKLKSLQQKSPSELYVCTSETANVSMPD